jgi:hypothetical protein
MSSLATDKPRTKSNPIPPSSPRNQKPIKVAAAKSPKAASAVPEAAPAVGMLTVTPKQTDLIQLMQRTEGLALAELMKLTGWQSHSVRGWVSGVLRKKLGLVVTRFKSDAGDTCYHIEAVAS